MGAVRTLEASFARLLTREVEMFLDFDLGQQPDDGAWYPSWDGGSRLPQCSPTSGLPEELKRGDLPWVEVNPECAVGYGDGNALSFQKVGLLGAGERTGH